MRPLKALLVVGVVLGGTLASTPAYADHHFMVIDEVYAGTTAEPNTDFVELKMTSTGQRLVAGHKIRVFNADGSSSTDYTFGSSVPNGASGSSILMATASAESYFGVQADLELTDGNVIDPTAGKACFVSTTVLPPDIDCVSWGSFTGSSGGSGIPAAAMPSEQSLKRIAGDSNDSATDFSLSASPAPRSNAGITGNLNGRFSFSPATYTVGEDETDPVITVRRTGTGKAATIDFEVTGGSATAPGDYSLPGSSTLGFAAGDDEETFTVTVNPDGDIEGTETIVLGLTNPSPGATIGTGSATINVLDEDAPPDTTKPRSRFTKPKNNNAYVRGGFTKLTGTATDAGGSSLQLVQVSIRQTLKNGKCRWFTGSRFASGACGTKQRWRQTTGTATWSLPLGAFRLPASKGGSSVAFYTAFARGRDLAGNTESSFGAGRNANRFEIT